MKEIREKLAKIQGFDNFSDLLSKSSLEEIEKYVDILMKASITQGGYITNYKGDEKGI